MRASKASGKGNELFARACTRLADVGVGFGLQRRRRRKSENASLGIRRQRTSEQDGRDDILSLERQLRLSELDVGAECVLLAARTAGMMCTAGLATAAVLAFILVGHSAGVLLAMLCPVVNWAATEAIKSYPHAAARRRASRVVRESTSATNLMIMSLRQDPSLPKAVGFASRHMDEFSRELRQSVWNVIMGSYSSFEESLLHLGERWRRHAPEIKSSIASMITAASESSEEGRRRALERANATMVTGAKRRIEEYALSLSTPSMILFGLGILLPIMVGSFLPILSWDLWSTDASGSYAQASGVSDELVQTAFFMNVLFPAIAFLVAANAISNHPLTSVRGRSGIDRRRASRELVLALSAAAMSIFVSVSVLTGAYLYLGVLFSVTLSMAAWLISIGRGKDERNADRDYEDEDDLFKVGSRMLEGENLESAMAAVARESGARGILRRLTFRTSLMGQDMTQAVESEGGASGDANVVGALRIVHDSACKDESTAGLLAMDLATYIRDLRSLDSTLRSRLKPTVSMMKTTANLLGPVVLGITYVMYLTLSTMVPGESGLDQAGIFFLILGAFLAEINVVVVYFVWGIEGKDGRRSLASSTGICILLSELVFAATAVLAS